MQFQEVLSGLGVPYLSSGAGGHTREGWINFACPFCGGGKHRDSMGYNLSAGFLNCYRCGGHNAVETVAELGQISFKEAKKLLEGVESNRSLVIPDKRGKLVLPKGIREMQKAHRKYLRRRGFDPDEIAKLWGVQGIGHASRLKWRLFIPIELDGETVSWTTRAISDEASLRYISASAEEEKVNHKTVLYGEQYARRHSCCILEGPFDVWRGGPGYLGTCGTGYSRAQVARMAKYLRRGIWFDNEPEAQRRARELADMLSPFPGETFVINSDSKDPDSASDKEWRQVRRTLGL